MQPDRIMDDTTVPTSEVGPWIRHTCRGSAVDGRHLRSPSSDAAALSGPEPEALRQLARLLGRQAARQAFHIRRHGGLGHLPVGIMLAIIAVALAALMRLVSHLGIESWP